MDFLMNAAKIAEQVQGGKKQGEGSGGGYGEMLSGFMGGGDNPKPKPRRDEEYGEEGPHGSKPGPRRDEEDSYGDERPHGSSSSAANKKKPSTGDLFSSAQVSFLSHVLI